ncbi:myosin-11 isoform X2 [Manduca sexta]|uniref:myosin-11 isoform X2 n=1 Tax=Manduca sexta TaxID=7130 RepID=UPI00188FAD46|nr:myosin-11 isoform X2 [Manduca sexta]
MTMNLSRESASTDEYYVTALQIFEYCGAQSSGALHVEALMDKFAPFVKTNKSEYNFLKSLLDPEQSNPEINVTKLAKALHKYSESQKTKVDLDESFNLKTGQTPQDSDSGISTDGFQLLEELQCELREKAHLAAQLRSQLEFTDKQHEEALATLTAERDSLKAHLNMLRDENMSLVHVRRDYEEACERLCGSEQALHDARRELDAVKRRARVLHEQVATLETEKLTLQELLTKSKDECHRINEMYATRQSALLEENENLKTDHADLAARLQDQEEFMQQMIKEKVLLEMELKDVFNKSNQTHLRMDRSIDISYTEDQMLSALDSLNADSRFSSDHQILDEESFVNALKEDQGRATNMSLFDEIRLSFCNISRHNIINIDKKTESICDIDTSIVSYVAVGVQTENIDINKLCDVKSMQTDIEPYANNNNVHDSSTCLECVKANKYTAKLERDVKQSRRTLMDLESELVKYEDNLDVLQEIVQDGNDRNKILQSYVDGLQSKIDLLEQSCERQRSMIDSLICEKCSAECQTQCEQVSVSTQADAPCAECEQRNLAGSQRSLKKFFCM